MNTPAHILIGAAAFGRRGAVRVLLAALLGGILPDLSLYLMAGAALFVLQIPAATVFNELYFSDAWQTVFAIDNSLVVWALLLGLALWWGRAWAVALTGAALLHLGLDLPLHHDDGRAHFWPLSAWVYESPLSYWDRDQGAMWIAPIEAGLATAAAVLLFQARQGWGWLMLTGGLLIMELWIVRQWLFVFNHDAMGA